MAENVNGGQHMRVGIIGYGSMGKMLLWKFSQAAGLDKENLFVSNRTPEKLKEAEEIATVCGNREAASLSDIVFVCVRPSDLKNVLEEISDALNPDTLLVSLNGSVSFQSIGRITGNKAAKVIPSLTAEIGRSQTLVCFNEKAGAADKENLLGLLKSIGEVIELLENEMGMGSELVSCMPGFIASIFDVICKSAQSHTSIPEDQIVSMVLSTMSATADLMIQNGMSFNDVVNRVATKGGITEEGTKVVYNDFPATADLLFANTLEKRRKTAEAAGKAFSGIHIYFDSDGVLADMKGYMDAHDIPYNPDGVCDKSVDEIMWGKIREIDHFYDKLDPLPGSVELFKELSSKYDCAVLTAVPKEKWGITTSGEDKINWCRRLLGDDVKVHIVYRAQKADFVMSKKDVLIDDLEINIKEWEAGGGTGILFTGAENFDYSKLVELM